MYRAPDDWTGKTILKTDDGENGNVELIQRHHRLAAVPPSHHHTEQRYCVYDEHTGNLVPGGRIPPLQDWPKLPDAWLEGLRTDPAKAVGGEATAEEIEQFAAEHTGNAQPWHLTEYVVPKVRNAAVDTRNAAFEALHEAARMARVGWYSWETAVAEIEAAARGSYAKRDTPFDEADFARSARYAVQAANAEDTAKLEARALRRLVKEQRQREGLTRIQQALARDGWAGKLMAALDTESEPRAASAAPVGRHADEYKVFKVMEPSEWAAPVPEQEFLIRGALARDTFGPNAGPKKSLKTHDNMAMAIAVGTGQNLYLSEHFPVVHPGRVLYIVGEGGEKPTRRTLRRVCRAYGINPDDMMSDPSNPIILVTGAAPIDDKRLRGEICKICDRYGPFVLVLMESFYNFHPAGVNPANLFERGVLIDDYHKFIRRAAGEDVTSLLTDHYRSTGNTKSLDLDNISMTGQAENADSWVTRYHRAPPNVSEGEFWLRVGFSSRQWARASGILTGTWADSTPT